MLYIKMFESYSETNLIIVDVQKSFSKYFTNMYVEELKKYAKKYTNVYQIWDNHVDGADVGTEYLYEKEPDTTINKDLYTFPNQKEVIEKRYNYDVDVTFYKKILDKSVFNKIEKLEDSNKLQKGNYFNTTEGTIIVFVNNNHRWFHLPKKLYDIIKNLSGKEVVICGGSDSECLEDVRMAGVALGVKIREELKYIYTATHCPIK